MTANAEAAIRNSSSACWIDWETDGVVSRGTEGGIMEVVGRMTVETGLAEGWRHRVDAHEVDIAQALQASGGPRKGRCIVAS